MAEHRRSTGSRGSAPPSGATLVAMALAVGVGRQVGSADGDRRSKVGHLLVEGSGDPVKAGVQQRLALARTPQLSRT